MALLGQQFHTILELDKEFAMSLTDTLERTTIDLLDNLEAAIVENDNKRAKELLHTIKGGCANYGAEQMTSTAASLEKKIVYLEHSNTEDFKLLVVKLHAELIETLREARNL